MITTPEKQEEHRPDGLNVLSTILNEIKALKEALAIHEERLNNLTLNIPDTTLNTIIARTLDMHAQVLMAATRPQPVQQVEAQPVETPEETEAATQETTA